jgi:hypothetical protein
VNTIAALIGGDQATAQQVVAQLDTSPLTTFTTLLVTDEKKQADQKKPADGIVSGSNTCTK